MNGTGDLYFDRKIPIYWLEGTLPYAYPGKPFSYLDHISAVAIKYLGLDPNLSDDRY